MVVCGGRGWLRRCSAGLGWGRWGGRAFWGAGVGLVGFVGRTLVVRKWDGDYWQKKKDKKRRNSNCYGDCLRKKIFTGNGRACLIKERENIVFDQRLNGRITHSG